MKGKAVKSHIKLSKSERTLKVVCYLIAGVFAFFCIVPFIYIIACSFSEEALILKNGFKLIPQGFTTAAYEVVFGGKQIWISYGVSIFVTVVGTLLSMLVSSVLAYPLAAGIKYGSKINLYIYFTMIFNGGLVPTYMLVSRYLHLTNTVWSLILPSMIIPWNVFLLRNFFSAIPSSLSESAKLDGANDATILFRIILPCSKPALATVSLFYALGYWNEWFKAMLYNAGDKNTWPLQYLIMQLIRKTETLANMASQGAAVNTATLPSTTMKMATALCTIGPIILVYPIAQKYFTGGIMVGSVKG